MLGATLLLQNDGMKIQSHTAFLERICEAPKTEVAGGGPSELGRRAAADLQALRHAAGAHLSRHLEDERVSRLLLGVFEGSPYLSGLILRDAARLERILASVPEELFAAWSVDLHSGIAAAKDDVAAKRILRLYKNQRTVSAPNRKTLPQLSGDIK